MQIESLNKDIRDLQHGDVEKINLNDLAYDIESVYHHHDPFYTYPKDLEDFQLQEGRYDVTQEIKKQLGTDDGCKSILAIMKHIDPRYSAELVDRVKLMMDERQAERDTKNLTKLKGKLQNMEKAGHKFSLNKNGKVKVPEGAANFLTEDEIKQTTQMIEKEMKRQAPQRFPGQEMG